ncbi:MAG: 5-formyltetrahydrofolate cyclo-ligase [Proteobacteria bacterium]|nr:5-formyltetrahydrofolate cyclo-ligase [Pseudomonadota bacterium]MCP4917379.1 5-formyltetrahydrofolate cyclo-ligase [Pseudomonadota bacterium]
MDKARLRKTLRARRRALSDRPLRSVQAAGHLLGSPRWAGAVGLFHSIGAEISTRPLLERGWAHGLQLALPIVVGAGRPLEFRRVFPDTPLQAGAFGVLEPQGTERVDALDLIVLPGLAFDRAGGRLGYGGGYYDRTLARSSAFRVMLAFADQEVADVPMGAHDERVQAVVTEDGWLAC